MLVADYTFIDFFWSMFVFSLWILWFWFLFMVWTDIFRRGDISGWAKAAWFIFTLALPFLGTLIYIGTQNEGIKERGATRAQRERREYAEYVQATAGASGGAAAEIERGKELLDRGVITQAEFDVLKTNALAT
jgi:hypothetical protein